MVKKDEEEEEEEEDEDDDEDEDAPPSGQRERAKVPAPSKTLDKHAQVPGLLSRWMERGKMAATEPSDSAEPSPANDRYRDTSDEEQGRVIMTAWKSRRATKRHEITPPQTLLDGKIADSRISRPT